jgi:hypothetical protein
MLYIVWFEVTRYLSLNDTIGISFLFCRILMDKLLHFDLSALIGAINSLTILRYLSTEV